MKRFARVRCTVGLVALAGFAAAGVVGFGHAFQHDPEFGGGRPQVAAVQHVHETGPGWSGGVQPADLSYPQPDQVHEGGPAWGGGQASS